MNWFFLAMLGPALWAIVCIIDDNLLRTVYKNPYAPTIVSGIFGLLPLLSLFFVKISIPSTDIILWSILAGFILICAYFFYFKVLAKESPAITSALWNLSPAFIPFLAFIFLGEIVSITKYFGFGIIFISSMALSVVDIKKLKFSRSLYLMIITSFLTACMSIMEKHVYNNVAFWNGFIFVCIGMGFGGLFFSLAFKKGREFTKNSGLMLKKYIWLFLATEIINLLAVLVLHLAVSKGPVSLVKVILGTESMYILLFSIALFPLFPKYFREATHSHKIRKFIIIGIMIFGLYLINI